MTTNANLKPIDDLLANWKQSCIDNLPILYANRKKDLNEIKQKADANEITFRQYLDRRDAIDTKYGKLVREWGYIATKGPESHRWNDFIAYLDKQCAAKKTIVIARCDDKIGGITSVEWIATGRTGEIEGYITGPEGRIHLHSILAGGYNIQRLHVRFLINKLKK